MANQTIEALPRYLRRRVQSQLGAAVIFLILGIGNLSYGSLKLHQYQRLISEAKLQLSADTAPPLAALASLSVNVDEQSHHIRRLFARKEFYSLVTIVGSCFLIVFFLFAATAALTVRSLRKNEQDQAAG